MLGGSPTFSQIDVLQNNYFPSYSRLTLDINLSPWKDSTRKFSYLKPVGGKFGSVKCMSTETIKVEDPEVGFEIEGITKTPDVPSGKRWVVFLRWLIVEVRRGC